MTNSQAKWYIHHFADYHEINDIGEYKSIELGCFPTKESSYHRYFGLFYTGRKPGADKVLDAVLGLVDVIVAPKNEEDYDETTTTANEVKESIRLALKN